MEANIYDLVREATSTEGDGLTLTLDSVVGYARFADAVDVGETIYYSIYNGGNREVGIGTVQAGDTLDRTTILTTLEAGVYTNPASLRISLIGDSEIAITPAAETLLSIEVEMSARAFLLIGA